MTTPISTSVPVRVPIGTHSLAGDLSVPDPATGLVLFVHGSGSSRHSPRNQFVASTLQERGCATLLLDLLTEDEDALDARTARLRFDIVLLADRLVAVIDWLQQRPDTGHLPVGLFGASAGAGAALVAAAERPRLIRAVVSRGGRPDLAAEVLRHVLAPTLLIVGGADRAVLDLNRAAQAQMRGATRLEIVPGATHLFEERGALDRVAALAGEWFARYLVDGDARSRGA